MSEKGKDISQLLSDDSFVSWIEGTAGREDILRWETWIAQHPENKKRADEARQIHQSLQFRRYERADLESELKRLNKAIDEGAATEDSKGKMHFLWSKNWQLISRVAAVFLFIVAVFAVYQANRSGFFEEPVTEAVEPEYTTTVTENGQKKVLTLSDGSKITLNANSELTYPARFTDGGAEVWLEGEAFFEIVRNPEGKSRSFMVHIPHGRVEVLGTTFNVNSYKEETQVFLQEGKVSLELRDTLDQVKDTYIMNPGDLSLLSLAGETISTTRGDSELYTSWVKDKLVFDNASLGEVAERLGHIYQVKFDVDEPAFDEIHISGSLPNNNLSVFLNALESLLDRSIIVEDQTIHLGEPTDQSPNQIDN